MKFFGTHNGRMIVLNSEDEVTSYHARAIGQMLGFEKVRQKHEEVTDDPSADWEREQEDY